LLVLIGIGCTGHVLETEIRLMIGGSSAVGGERLPGACAGICALGVAE
jgi:hypothetical protein